jgi:CBS domain-containing protein
MKIGDVCKRNVVTARAADDLTKAAQLMRSKHVGYIIVVEPEVEEGSFRPIGVLTDRDIVIEVVAGGADPKTLTVGDIMTAQPVTVADTASITAAMAEMRRIGVRRLPVVGHRGQLAGIVSLDDIIDRLASELQNVAGSIRNEQSIEGALRT